MTRVTLQDCTEGASGSHAHRFTSGFALGDTIPAIFAAVSFVLSKTAFVYSFCKLTPKT